MRDERRHKMREVEIEIIKKRQGQERKFQRGFVLRQERKSEGPEHMVTCLLSRPRLLKG